MSVLALASSAFVHPVGAQVLDLDSGGRMPAIEGGVLAELAERSLERIEPERNAPESVRATNQLRRIVAELAVRASRRGRPRPSKAWPRFGSATRSAASPDDWHRSRTPGRSSGLLLVGSRTKNAIAR